MHVEPDSGGQKPEFLHLDAQAEADTATHEIKTINKSGPKGGLGPCGLGSRVVAASHLPLLVHYLYISFMRSKWIFCHETIGISREFQ